MIVDRCMQPSIALKHSTALMKLGAKSLLLCGGLALGLLAVILAICILRSAILDPTPVHIERHARLNCSQALKLALGSMRR